MKFHSKFLIILFLITSLPGFADSVKRDLPIVENGVIDLSEIKLDNIERIKLDGQWEFYWNSFLFFDDFVNNREYAAPEYIPIPGSWTLDTAHPAWGYATLRIKIKGLSPHNIYSLYVPDIISNYRLWIDGKEMSSNGKVGENASDSKPQFLPKTISFETHGDTVDLIIHISNFDYRKSGIWRSLFLGTQESIRSFSFLKLMFATFLTGILLAISLFHIGVYVYRRNEKTEFIFGLVCFTLLIRIITTGEQILTFFIPEFPWEILRRMEYIPFYLTAPLIALFLSYLFPDEASKLMNKLYAGVCSLLGLFILIFPVRITNNSMPFAQLLLIIGIIYALTIMVKALLHKRESAVFITTAYVIFSIAVINDILYSNLLIPTMYLSPYGFVIFIIIQSQMLTRRFTRSFTQREILAKSRDKFRHASLTDSLTGLYNVRFLEQTMEKEMLNSLESSLPLSVIMADVDNFKIYNDTWGHKQGDIVLKEMAQIISKSAREKDSPCRYGGEEFAIILPETSLNEAAEVSERIRLRFETAEDDDKRMHGITVSIGVAQFVSGESADALIERADKALYKAKHNGKNRVELAK